jgi:glutaredoxin
MFKIFLKPGCPYCAETVSLLNKHTIKYETHTEPDPEKREMLKKKNKMNTFPQVFYVSNKKSVLIGGNDELKQKIIFCKKLAKTINNNTINMDLQIAHSIKPSNKIKHFIKKLFKKK